MVSDASLLLYWAMNEFNIPATATPEGRMNLNFTSRYNKKETQCLMFADFPES